MAIHVNMHANTVKASPQNVYKFEIYCIYCIERSNMFKT